MVKHFKKIKRYSPIALLAVLLILLPTRPVNASFFEGYTLSVVTNIFSYIVYILFTVVGKFIGALAVGLNSVINMPVYPAGGIAVIDQSWKIMRNFANMFFIIALIMMAFATIFDVFPGAAKYNARALFARFLFTALLINFSLVLGVLVIKASQVLSNTFLISIGDMSARLGQGMNPANLFPSASSETLSSAIGNAVDQKLFGALIGMIFTLVLLFTMLFSLLTAFIFAVIRIPILWALLVVSPMAWMLNIFPGGQGMYKKWWSTFIGWNMFLPIFLFFLYFGLLFLNNQSAVIQAISQQTSRQSLGEGVPFTFQELFFYVMASIFLIGGTITAMKAAMFSGTGVIGVAGWARGRAKRWVGLQGAQQAWQEKKAQVMAGEGRLGRIFGGPAPGLAGARKLIGVRGADFKTQKEFVDRASKEFENIQNQYDTGKTSVNDIVAKAKQGSATNPETYAYRKMAAKMGKLDNDIFQKTVTELSSNPYATQDFIRTAKEAKFSDVNPNQIIDFAARQGNFSDLGPNSLPGRRETYKYIQSNAKVLGSSNFSQEQFNKGIELFGGHTTADGQSFMEEVSKVRPDLVVDYQMQNEQVMNKINEKRVEDGKAPITQTNKSEMFDGYIKDAKDVANLPVSVWNNTYFQQALQRKLIFGSAKAQRNFRNRIIDNLRTAAGGDRKKTILDGLQGARDTGQNEGEDYTGEDDLDIDNEEGGSDVLPRGGLPGRARPVPGAVVAPTPDENPPAPPRRPSGFVRPGEAVGPGGVVGGSTATNPGNIVDLRNAQPGNPRPVILDEGKVVGGNQEEFARAQRLDQINRSLDDTQKKLRAAEERMSSGGSSALTQRQIESYKEDMVRLETEKLNLNSKK